MGTVTHPAAAENHFTKALHYLREAQSNPHYKLPDHLRQFLSYYGRYID